MSLQRYPVRGFIAGTVKRWFGVTVTTAKIGARGTVYSIAADARSLRSLICNPQHEERRGVPPAMIACGLMRR